MTPAVFTQGVFSFAFAALCFPEVAPLPFAAGTLSLVAGFSTLALLGETGPQLGHAADEDIVLACPVGRGAFYVARVTQLGIHLGVFVLGLAIAPAILLAFTTGSVAVVPIYLGLSILLAASLCALVELPILCAGKLGGPGAATALSAVLRALLTGGLFLGLLLGMRVLHQGASGTTLDLLELLPPYWYACLLRSLQGEFGGPAIFPLAAVLLPVVVAALLVGVSALPARSRSAGRSGRRGLRVLAPLTGLLTRGTAERGMCAFVLVMLARERSFRLRALPLLGLPAAIAALGFLGEGRDAELPLFLSLVHNLPIVYLPFLVFFLPHASDFEAAWLVEASHEAPAALSRRAVAAAFAICLVPLQGALFVLDLSLRGAADAAATSLAALGISWLLLPYLASALRGTCFGTEPDALEAPGTILPTAGMAMFVALAALSLEFVGAGGRALVGVALIGAGVVVLRSRRPE